MLTSQCFSYLYKTIVGLAFLIRGGAKVSIVWLHAEVSPPPISREPHFRNSHQSTPSPSMRPSWSLLCNLHGKPAGYFFFLVEAEGLAIVGARLVICAPRGATFRRPQQRHILAFGFRQKTLPGLLTFQKPCVIIGTSLHLACGSPSFAASVNVFFFCCVFFNYYFYSSL